jgi:thiol:disulfide interchange protein
MLSKNTLSTTFVTLLAFAAGCKSDNDTKAQVSVTKQSGIEFVVAPQLANVAPWIAEQKTLAVANGKQILVYVGAPWCEPCEVFHKAAVDGLLNADFPNLRLLQFDSDRDNDAITAAGYGSEMIPLFAEIGDNGRASGRTIAGAVKGNAAIASITPRLKTLLAPPAK